MLYVKRSLALAKPLYQSEIHFISLDEKHALCINKFICLYSVKIYSGR